MEWVDLPAGHFQMGAPLGQGFVEDYEAPAVSMQVAAFSVATTPVTNQEFAEFVAATGYETIASRTGGSLVFEALLSEDLGARAPRVPGTPWWRVVAGADWLHPFGPEGPLATEALADHPVVHVSLADALSYCQWAGVSLPTEAQWAGVTLPTEAQWEYAARAGRTTTFPWGQELEADGIYHANTWQGDFPRLNSQADGYLGTAPVKTYAPNDWGLYQVIGNVWEWCANPRYQLLQDFKQAQPLPSLADLKGEYAIRGGSFLCHASYCQRYRLGARNGADALVTASHIGFRSIK